MDLSKAGPALPLGVVEQTYKIAYFGSGNIRLYLLCELKADWCFQMQRSKLFITNVLEAF